MIKIIFIRKLQIPSPGPMSRRQSHAEIQRGNLSMSSIRNTRALRLSLAAFLVCGALSLSARTAHAQWAEPVCMDPASIPGLFTGMDYSGLEKCESHCKYTGNLCKAFAKDAASCNQSDSKGYWTLFSRISCDTQALPADRKSCNQMVSSIKSDTKDSINSERDVAVAQCDVLISTCLQACAAPPI